MRQSGRNQDAVGLREGLEAGEFEVFYQPIVKGYPFARPASGADVAQIFRRLQTGRIAPDLTSATVE
jgi:EAL domain-containing protein (putative c-di-GMP-specific phosphodiesterase class I)